MKQIAIICLAGLLALGIAYENGLAQDTKKYDESFDPLKLKEPKSILFQEQSQNEVARQLSADTTRNRLQEQDTQSQQTGYRVQLMLTPNYQEADSVFMQVREIFQDEAKPHLIYDSPNYKIQLGDYRTRDQAEQYRDVAQKRGFRFSWVVPSVIESTEEE